MAWIRGASKPLLECVSRINELEDETFQQILTFVYDYKVCQTLVEVSVEDALKDLQETTKLEDNMLLMTIKTISHIFKRALKFIMKPTRLQADLTKILGFEEKKAEAFIKYWIREQKQILDNLETETGETNELKDVSWNLEVDLASEAREKEKTPVGLIELKTSAGDSVTFHQTHAQLSKFFDQLEEITQELDNLRKS
ncbi:uncharacterized protein LOC129793926 [Lutzomyia longipalpis]|uniref:uncharacterized protein LOC129793926 n=1 Tax=Lutzomyia longipalpis TaxID=7200 RepID=UPI00248358D6|nr:uncharacterized protein LOC129793926 [Lutzomyia longipalpis]